MRAALADASQLESRLRSLVQHTKADRASKTEKTKDLNGIDVLNLRHICVALRSEQANPDRIMISIHGHKETASFAALSISICLSIDASSRSALQIVIHAGCSGLTNRYAASWTPTACHIKDRSR